MRSIFSALLIGALLLGAAPAFAHDRPGRPGWSYDGGRNWKHYRDYDRFQRRYGRHGPHRFDRDWDRAYRRYGNCRGGYYCDDYYRGRYYWDRYDRGGYDRGGNYRGGYDRGWRHGRD